MPERVTQPQAEVYFYSKDGTVLAKSLGFYAATTVHRLQRKITDLKIIDMHRKCNVGATQKILNTRIGSRPPRELNVCIESCLIRL